MSGVYESLKETYGNFQKYVKYSTIPAIKKSDNSRVPQNSFYKSVYYIDSVVGPVKDVLFGVKSKVAFDISLGGRNHGSYGITLAAIEVLTSIVLQPLYLVFAYLSYWPAKGLAKVTDKFGLKDNTKSLVDYSNMFPGKAWKHSGKAGEFVGTVLSYVCTAVIWAAALIITPLVWAVDKVASKFSDAKTKAANHHENTVTAS